MAVFTIRRNGPAHLGTETISSNASRNGSLIGRRDIISRPGGDAVPLGPQGPRQGVRALARAEAMTNLTELIHAPARLRTTLGALILRSDFHSLPGSLASLREALIGPL